MPQILHVLVIDGLMCPQVEHVHLVMRLMILVMAVRIHSAVCRA